MLKQLIEQLRPFFEAESIEKIGSNFKNMISSIAQFKDRKCIMF